MPVYGRTIISQASLEQSLSCFYVCWTWSLLFFFVNACYDHASQATVKGESSDSPGIQLCTKILFFGTMAFVFAAPMFAVWILVSGYAVIEGRAIWSACSVMTGFSLL